MLKVLTLIHTDFKRKRESITMQRNRVYYSVRCSVHVDRKSKKANSVSYIFPNIPGKDIIVRLQDAGEDLYSNDS